MTKTIKPLLCVLGLLGSLLAMPALSATAAAPAPAAAADEINGVVWNDLSADGVNDPTESGNAGQLVTIYDSAATEVASMTTASDGLYSFTGLDAAAGPYRVTVTRDTSVYSDPSNWIASAATPTQPGYIGTDQDFARSGSAVPVAEATGLNPGDSADAAIRPRPELSLGLFGPGVIDGGGNYNTLGNCANPTDVAEPGDDCGEDNGQIRSNDLLTTVWSVTASNYEPGTADWGPVMFTQTITPDADDPATPADESAVTAFFDGLPVSCVAPPNGTGGANPPSEIIDNPDGGQTLNCNLGQFNEGAQESLTVAIKVEATSANKSGFSLSQGVHVDDDRAVPAAVETPIEMEVSSRPAFDVRKLNFRNYDPVNWCVDTDGDSATPCEQLPGYVTYFIIRVSSDQATGIESIAQPYTLTDDISAVLDDGVTPYSPEFYVTECRPNPSGWGDTVLGYGGGPPGAPGVTTYYPDRRLEDSGTCDFTRDDPANNTSQYSFELDNADLDGSYFPTTTWGGHQDLSAGPYLYVEHRVQMFIPNRSIDMSDGVIDNSGSFQMFNSLGGFDPDSASGTSNFGDGVEPGFCSADFSTPCDLMEDGTKSNNTIGPLSVSIRPPGGSWHSYQMYRVNYTTSGYTNIPGIDHLHSGSGIVEPGDVSTSQTRLRSSGSTGLLNPTVCKVFDSTVAQLALGDTVRNGSAPVPAGYYAFATNSAFSGPRDDDGTWADRFVVEYAALDLDGDDPLYDPARAGVTGVVDSSFYPGTDTYSTTTGRFEGVWEEQRDARCDDSDAASTGGWVTDPNDPALGGIDNVNAVRMTAIDSTFLLEPGEYMTLNVPVRTRSSFVGGPHDGESIPPGAVYGFFANVKADDWGTGWQNRYYRPSPETTNYDGDRFTVARFTTRLQKRTLTPLTAVGVNGSTLAGNQVVWELIPAVSTNVVPSTQTARDVVVYDVLPPYTSYNAACTAALNNDPETATILPDLVEPNTDMNGIAAGYTRLTYFVGDLAANVAADRIRVCSDTDSLAPNGTTVNNYAELRAEDDITVLSTRSDSHAVVLRQNGSMQISKSVDRRLDPADDDQNYTIRYANYAAAFSVEPTTMIDVFPWNGDGVGSSNERDPASDFGSGSTLELTGPATVTFFDGSTPDTGAGDPFDEIAEVTYTADDPATIDYNPDVNASQWCLPSDFGSVAGCPTSFADATGLRVVSNYRLERDGDPRQGHVVDFALQALGNKPSDSYTNRATLDSASLPPEQFLRSNNVVVEVAGFNIGDLVFGDVNRDGSFDPNADVHAPEGVVVQLYADGSAAAVASTTTDENGRYLFTGIGAGSYYVLIPDSEFQAGALLEDWRIQPVGMSADPNTDQNENQDHHAVGITPGTSTDGVRTAGTLTLSATVPASPLLNPTGDEPLGDNVGGLAATVGDDFTNFTLDLGLIPPTRPSINVEKSTNGADADTGSGPYIAVGEDVTWQYVVTNTGGTALADVNVTDDTEGAATYVSGDDGDGFLDVDEAWTFELTGTAEEGQYANKAVVLATPADFGGGPIPGVDSIRDDDWSHYFGVTTSIDIEKSVQTSHDADTATGPLVALGDDVRFTYVVKNTGATTLEGVSVTDDVLGAVGCPTDTLAPGESMTCTVDGVAVAGQYTSTGTATGSPVDPDGNSIDALDDPTDEDDAHYLSASPSVDIEKFVQSTFDADDSASGPVIDAAGTVRFTYVVTNDGNTDLTNVAVDDDIEGTITCPATTLAVDESMTCTLSGVAAIDSGVYENTGTATADGPATVGPNGEVVAGEEVTDEDQAHYTASDPQIDIQKFVQTTWDANEQASAPAIVEGAEVLFTYIVTNTGLVDLTAVVVMDDVEGAITCPATTLAVAESMTCTLTATAQGDNYTNVGTATAMGPATFDENGDAVAGDEATDQDPAYYFGVNPAVSIRKVVQTTFDANAGDPIPLVAEGDVVKWEYVVRNTGNVPLTGVTVTDDRILNDSTINCGQGAQNVIPALASMASVTCTAYGTAEAAPYTNIGSVSGTGPTTISSDGLTQVPGETVAAQDEASYTGVLSDLKIETTVQSALYDADTAADGPLVAPGDDTRITYVVTNPGTSDVTDIVVNDDVHGTPTFVSGDTNSDGVLQVGETWIYESSLFPSGTPGVYSATGEVTGTGQQTMNADGDPVSGTAVDASDPHVYTVPEPGIDVETSVAGGLDADVDGPLVDENGQVEITYVVTNTGTTEIASVTVVDDDYGTAALASGDTNGDGILQVDETWNFTLMVNSFVDAPGETISATGTVEGTGPAMVAVGDDSAPVPGVVVTDDDSHSWSTATATLNIETTVQTAFDADDEATGPLVDPAGNVLVTSTVTNGGTAAAANVVVTDAVHGASTYVSGDTNDDGLLQVDETWIFTTLSPATAAGADDNSATVIGNGPDRVDGVSGAAVASEALEAADDHHYTIAAPSVGVEKSVQTVFDADDPGTGPLIDADGTVTFTYVVTNDGNVALNSVAVADSVEGAIDCPLDVLAAGATMTCEITGVEAIDSGEYANTGTATATPPPTIDTAGDEVPSDEVVGEDDAHYTSADPQIDVQKFVQTVFDANDPDAAPAITEGSTVRFTYIVTNAGGVDLTNIVVTDEIAGEVLCPKTELAAGESMTCTFTDVAAGDNYSAAGTATAVGPETFDEAGNPVAGEEVSGTDSATYTSVSPSVDIEKFVQTTFDADTPAGPTVAVGEDVRFTYVVTNDGNVALTNVVVTDDQIDVDSDIDCGDGTNVIASLGVDDSITCIYTEAAVADQYTNTGQATGNGPDTADENGEVVTGEVVTDEDDANYFGVGADIHIETTVQTTFDADAPGTGPSVAAGSDVLITYTVTSDGNAALSEVTVDDDTNGNPVYQSGDTNGDGLLDIGETWTYTLTVAAPESGEIAATATATGRSPEAVNSDGDRVLGVVTVGTDPHHYSVPKMGLEIVKLVDGVDAGSGVEVPEGETMTITYVVTNTGDLPVTDIVVVDDVEGVISCPQTVLEPGESMSCILTGVSAPAGGEDYGTVASVSGVGGVTFDANGEPVNGDVIVMETSTNVRGAAEIPQAGGGTPLTSILPTTGSSSTAMLVRAGLALLLLGIAATLIAFRRRRPESTES